MGGMVSSGPLPAFEAGYVRWLVERGIGGLFTTYASWLWVLVGEALIVLAILVVGRGPGPSTR